MRTMKKLLLICLCAALLLAGCGKEKDPPASTGAPMTYTVSVCTAGGMGLEDVTVYIYEDSTLQELVSVVKTDAEGKASFTDVARDTYVAVLQDLPTGYEAEEFYAITGALTEIVLQTGQLEDTDIEELTYKLGDAMMNFTVTAPSGQEYTFNGLFEGKKAVVLNFFYNECEPCKAEFPYLQEAYEQYSDDIAVLAMNPVNTDNEAIAALQKELDVTFPMVACDPQWEKIMQLTAYPTTVIIDRFGNICLIHKGSVPDTKTFTDAFAYFTADDYEQKLIEAIGDLAVEEEEGTKENPTEVGGVSSFEVTVEPGKVVYLDIYKVTKMYLRIKSENAYVIYKEKTYKPDDGVVSVLISVPDTFTPTMVGIGNSGDKTETFKASIVAPTGTFNNPIKLKLGDFTAKVPAGNEQGIYYTYKATEDGTLTLKCVSAPKNVKYGYFLFNTTTNAMRNLEADSQTAEDGTVSVSVQAKKGQTVQVCISTLPDDKGSYPGATFKFNAAFTAGQIAEQEQIKTTDYTVTVLDDSQKPIANVSILVKVDGMDTAFTTNAQGVAAIKLPTGTYEGSFYVPDGYTAENTTFTLTEEAPNVKLTVELIRQLDYTVTVQNEKGEPLANVFLKIGDGQWLRTDAQGKVTVTLDVDQYSVVLMMPAGYAGEKSYTFPEKSTELTVTLTDNTGSAQNPEALKELGLLVKQLAAGDSDGYHYSYTAKEEGVFSLQVKNAPAEAFDILLKNGTQTAKLSESEAASEVTVPVKTGDRVVIQLYALQDAQGAYPAMELRLWTTVKPLPVGPEPEVPTDPSVPEESTGDTTVPEDSETTAPETTEPETTAPETSEPIPEIAVYTVTVTDTFGAPMQGIGVIILSDGAPVSMATTDANGVISIEAETSVDYTVELVFTDTEYYYDKAAAVLTATNRQLTVKLCEHLDESNFQEIYILNGNPAYTLLEGGTHVTLGSGRPNFSAEYENNCFFVFTPETPGTYQITAAPNVELSYWSTTSFINRLYGSTDEGQNDAITESISGSSVGNITYVIGVKADTGITDVVLTVARIGEPEFSIADQPWTPWQTGLSHTDAWMKETGTTVSNTGYSYPFQRTYLDITAADGTYNLYYDEANGYYRLYQGGPVVLVDLGAQDRFVSLFERVNGKDSYGGSAVTRYFYDATGAFVKKEDYTEYLFEIFTEMQMSKGNPVGYYPLTKDLMYVLQNGFLGWWDADSPNYLESFATANKNYAWMFPCCTVK